MINYFYPLLNLAVPELQGEPEDISKEKARMAASQVSLCFLILELLGKKSYFHLIKDSE